MRLDSGLFNAIGMIVTAIISIGMAAWWGPKIAKMDYDRKTGKYVDSKTGEAVKKKPGKPK